MAFKKGHTINIGRKLSDEWKKKIGLANKDKKRSEECRKKNSEWHKNRKLSEETKKRMSEVAKNKGFGKWMLGKKRSEKTRKKLSESHKGINIWTKGVKRSEEFKQKMKNCVKRGKEHMWWKGGISFEPYSTDWTETLKKSIRERDHYICQICNGNGYLVHHIDYDKKNCDSKNLITLCNSCHSKTNHNRSYWMNYFRYLIII